VLERRREEKKLSKRDKDVETKEQIASRASISAGETAIGEMISRGDGQGRQDRLHHSRGEQHLGLE